MGKRKPAQYFIRIRQWSCISVLQHSM